ncbi:DUF6888 family protein [Vasconcelosia minhoensis]|uniref:DUF6888 family protein n=1 Tax=Vasconcelosia minhoensis TaxID=3366354 RepID=UPI0036F42A7B
MPAVEQAFTCVGVCQMLSNGYQPIHLFWYNSNPQTVFILAGVTESLEILVFSNGQWTHGSLIYFSGSLNSENATCSVKLITFSS